MRRETSPLSVPYPESSEPVPPSEKRSLSERAAAHLAPRYLTGLNEEQRRAVEALDGPVLVLAGAGVGKTRVLTTRIAHIIATGRARAHEILAVTFTNKAAREMRERVGALTGLVEGMPWMGTFHSIGVKVLRRDAELVGLKPNFTILDSDDQMRLLKQILQAENIDEKRWPARALAGQIDAWKNRGLDPAHVPAGESAAFANGRGAEFYRAYQERLKSVNAVDFGDLLLESLRLFREQPDILAQYQRRWRYILVDEYQDTNVVQYLWLRLLAQGHRNLCCVGDDDQSIYGWRGAEVDNILRFEHDFPGAVVVRLERNYRSGGHILAVASGLIAHNANRLGKTLYTSADLCEKPTVSGLWDSKEEARVIGDEIEAAQRAGVSLDEIAILVRASFQMREFEERFIELAIPYKVIGGPRFYERAEIRDALAYLRVVVQPDDDLAFERIFNTPRRGLGEATLNLLHAYRRSANVSLTRAARVLIESEELKARPRQLLRDLLADFDRWSAQVERTNSFKFSSRPAASAVRSAFHMSTRPLSSKIVWASSSCGARSTCADQRSKSASRSRRSWRGRAFSSSLSISTRAARVSDTFALRR
ncbi:MAG: UvrD-helicase domain-containing protein [Hyphomicrobiales bacterium]|nr:UvrD-helicase domain-containing protein [Hyphomicrobiales bacterium]